MLKVTLTVAAILALCCGGDEPANKADKGNSAQKQAFMSAPPCLCLLFSIEEVDEGLSMYMAEYHASGSECAQPDLQYPIYESGHFDQVCNVQDSCIPETAFASYAAKKGAKKVSKVAAHAGCLDPVPDNWVLEFPENDPRKILSNKVLKFREKNGPWIRARIYLMEYNSSNPKLYRQVALGKEIADEYEIDVIVDDQGGGKLVKKYKGGKCHYDVTVGSVTYRVLTRERN